MNTHTHTHTHTHKHSHMHTKLITEKDNKDSVRRLKIHIYLKAIQISYFQLGATKKYKTNRGQTPVTIETNSKYKILCPLMVTWTIYSGITLNILNAMWLQLVLLANRTPH